MNSFFVVPAPGRTVPDHVRGDLLPAAGRDVQKNQYWMRRIADRDVVVKKFPTEVKESSDAR